MQVSEETIIPFLYANANSLCELIGMLRDNNGISTPRKMYSAEEITIIVLDFVRGKSLERTITRQDSLRAKVLELTSRKKRPLKDWMLLHYDGERLQEKNEHGTLWPVDDWPFERWEEMMTRLEALEALFGCTISSGVTPHTFIASVLS